MVSQVWRSAVLAVKPDAVHRAAILLLPGNRCVVGDDGVVRVRKTFRNEVGNENRGKIVRFQCGLRGVPEIEHARADFGEGFALRTIRERITQEFKHAPHFALAFAGRGGEAHETAVFLRRFHLIRNPLHEVMGKDLLPVHLPSTPALNLHGPHSGRKGFAAQRAELASVHFITDDENLRHTAPHKLLKLLGVRKRAVEPLQAVVKQVLFCFGERHNASHGVPPLSRYGGWAGPSSLIFNSYLSSIISLF